MKRPAGVIEIREANQVSWFREGILSSLSAQLFDPDYWQQRHAVTGSALGRGTTWFVRDNGHDLVLRHYRRGGLFGRLVRDRYLGWQAAHSRPMREMTLLLQMHQAGLPVPEPVAARMVRHGLLYRGDLLIRSIAQARDLLAVLQDGALDANQWRTVGATIARFHAAGIDHTDLNIHNILLDQAQRCWLIDFDKCAQRRPGRWQQANLARLLRSLRKEKTLHPELHWQETHWAALLEGYRQP